MTNKEIPSIISQVTNKEIKEQYANMIRKWRLERNIGLRDFAEIIEISPSVLSHIETGMTKEECKELIRKLLKPEYIVKDGKRTGINLLGEVEDE